MSGRVTGASMRPADGAGTRIRDAAIDAVSVRLRGTGQWVALPPTTLGGIPAHPMDGGAPRRPRYPPAGRG